MDTDLPVRKPARLKNYDYSTPGAYFVTICTREKRCVLSRIVKPSGGDVGEGLAPPLRKKCNIAGVIGAFKSLCTHEWHRMGYAGPLWQRSFYDHIIRNEAEYREITEYIAGNPIRWADDRFYTPV